MMKWKTSDCDCYESYVKFRISYNNNTYVTSSNGMFFNIESVWFYYSLIDIVISSKQNIAWEMIQGTYLPYFFLIS